MIKCYNIGSYLYINNYKDNDILIVKDEDNKNEDIITITTAEFSKRFTNKFNTDIINALDFYKNISGFTDIIPNKNYYLSNLDKLIYCYNSLLSRTKYTYKLVACMLYGMNNCKGLSIHDKFLLEKIHDDINYNLDDFITKWNKFISKKRSRKIGYYCFDENDNYKVLTRKELRYEKTHSKYINDDGITIRLSN